MTLSALAWVLVIGGVLLFFNSWIFKELLVKAYKIYYHPGLAMICFILEIVLIVVVILTITEIIGRV